VAVCCWSDSLVEQARVLDGDHRLLGKIAHQLDLLVGERAHFVAVDAEDADQFILLEHWNGEESPKTAQLDCGHENRFARDVSGVRHHIDNVNHLLRLQDAAEGGLLTRPLRSALPDLGKRRRYTEHCGGLNSITFETE
jgi:hypothetical protein